MSMIVHADSAMMMIRFGRPLAEEGVNPVIKIRIQIVVVIFMIEEVFISCCEKVCFFTCL